MEIGKERAVNTRDFSGAIADHESRGFKKEEKNEENAEA